MSEGSSLDSHGRSAWHPVLPVICELPFIPRRCRRPYTANQDRLGSSDGGYLNAPQIRLDVV
jgi:hypothetical protein